MSPALHLILFILSFGIIALGLVMLKVAYDLPNPMEFIVVFFASSLIILIGMALAIGFALRVWSWVTKKNKKNP